MNTVASALDQAMEEVAKEHQEQPFCFTHESLLTCPCCAGSGEHVNIRDEAYTCSYCRGNGCVKVVRLLPAEDVHNLTERGEKP